MENLETMIQLLYKRVSLKKVITGKLQYNPFDQKEFLRMAKAYIFHYSEDEAVNLLNYFLDVFYKAAPLEGRQISNELNVFEPLFYFANKFLVKRNNEIVCRYRFLMEWRKMTTVLSEDMFIAAYYARNSTLLEMMNEGFSWKRVIGHDNAALNAIVRRGISENHCHLNGAAPIFQISWISLMNNVKMSQFANYLKTYDDNKRFTNIAYEGIYEEESLYQKYIQAVLIRLLLYSMISGKRLKIGNYDIAFRNVQDFLCIPPVRMAMNVQEVYMDEMVLSMILEELDGDMWKTYTYKELIIKIISSYQKVRGEETRGSDVFWELNPELACILQNPIGEYLLDGNRVREILCCSTGISLSQLFVRILAANGRISLEVIETIFCDKGLFLDIWDRRTLENVKELLANSQVVEWEKENIQSIIDSLRFEEQDESNKKRKLDYALKDLDYMRRDCEDPSFVYAGERWIMYMMFRKIYMNPKKYSEYFNLFYAYLLIKESIRSELVQSNENVGFRNFQIYQDRKSNLLADEIYKSEFTRLAVSDSLNSGNLLKMEVRIAPGADVEQNRQTIQRLDELLAGKREEKERLFYVVHFIKEADEKIQNTDYIQCRHHQKRKRLEKEAFALAELRERYPLAGERILGIDAASSEIGCRPEVFAPVFRYLKKHRSSYLTVRGTQEVPQLNATYHVGEDFLDPADGLRAIEEAVLFLNLESGERLGHALALGIDVQEWYRQKRYRVALPVQDYLDNLVWIFHKLFQYDIKGFESLKEWIQSKYSELFGKLYYINISQGEIKEIIRKHPNIGYNMMDMGIFNYYRAWELRGDDPEIYELGYFDKHKYLERGEEFRINFLYPKDFERRQIPEIALIHYMYHYNRKVREDGARTVEVYIPRNYVGAVAAIQKAMQKDIARRGIAIETNPSSNFLIGTFRQYEKHPILQFFNKGLVHDFEQMKECPQLSVSINTDDQGVFSTSLENEYALMACALESVCDENGEEAYNKADIYDWLDKIRIMGNEQSFANLSAKRWKPEQKYITET